MSSSGEPHWTVGSDPPGLFSAYLDFYREKAVEKVLALAPEQQDAARLPSGWTPVQLLHHLVFMEQRWFVWGFLAEPVADPRGDEVDGRWVVPQGRDVATVVGMLRAVGERTRDVLSRHRPEEIAATGGRFAADPPSLAWICVHVLQEYARHVGHLDVAVELAGGPLGE